LNRPGTSALDLHQTTIDRALRDANRPLDLGQTIKTDPAVAFKSTQPVRHTRDAMYEFLEETVERNMTSPAKSVAPEMTTGDLLRLFAADDLDAYPVVSNEKLVGIVSKADALKAFVLSPSSIIPHYDDIMGTTVDEIMTRHVVTVGSEARLQHVLHLMGAHHFKSLPVVDQSNRLKGMISREDVIRALAFCKCNQRQALPLVAPAVGYYAIA
jgi:CBS-domain-containing membrane protein